MLPHPRKFRYEQPTPASATSWWIETICNHSCEIARGRTGKAVAGISLRVIEVSEPDSSRKVYQVDLTNHPYRVAVYLCEIRLLVCSGLIGAFVSRCRRGRTKRRRLRPGGDLQRKGFKHHSRRWHGL